MPGRRKGGNGFSRGCVKFEPGGGGDYFGDYGGFRRGGGWAEDYPKAERQLVQGIRRLTRLDVRSYEQVVEVPTARTSITCPGCTRSNVGYWISPHRQSACGNTCSRAVFWWSIASTATPSGKIL